MLKSILSVLLTSMLISTANAEEYQITIAPDTPGQPTNTVFLNAENGSETVADDASWDLAFSDASPQEASIRTNKGYTVYAVPNSTFETFGTDIDTTGIAGWEATYNSDKEWLLGSLNMGKRGFADNDFDYGWGMYNMSNHYVTGSKVFLLATATGKMRQLLIDVLAQGKYVIKWANIDGSDPKEAIITRKAGGDGHQYVYFDFETREQFNRDPLIGEWDIQFTTYYTYIPQGGIHYPVAGILAAPNVRIAQVETPDPMNVAAPEWGSGAWSTNIDEIGYDWKTLSGTQYVINENVAYFIQRIGENGDPYGTPYRLVPQGYGSGVFTFDLTGTSSVESEGGKVTLFPAIAHQGQSIQLSGMDAGDSFAVFDAAGKVVSRGSGTYVVTDGLTAGKYFVRLGDENRSKVLQFVIQ